MMKLVVVRIEHLGSSLINKWGRVVDIISHLHHISV